jgi:hypothetical protein
MKLVKRCNDNVIARLIILHALYIRFALQKITSIIIFPLTQKEHQKYLELFEGSSISKGTVTSVPAADKKIIRR